MKIIFLIITVILPSLASAAMSCKGFYEWVDENDRTIFQEVDLKVTFETDLNIAMEANIGPAHFSVSGDKKDQDYLLLLSLGPNYVDGTTAAGSWNKQGAMRTARVDGTSVYKIKCKK